MLEERQMEILPSKQNRPTCRRPTPYETQNDSKTEPCPDIVSLYRFGSPTQCLGLSGSRNQSRERSRGGGALIFQDGTTRISLDKC